MYSLLEGLASPQQLVQMAKSGGQTALALTDFACLSGAVEFYCACKQEGIHPILGLEVALAAPAPGRVVLLATDAGGWRSLCHLSSQLMDAAINNAVPALTLDALEAHRAGLVCLTGGKNGPLTRLIQQRQFEQAQAWLDEIGRRFAGQCYVEIYRHLPSDDEIIPALLQLGRKTALPAAAAQAIYYLTPEQARLQRTLAAIRCNKPLGSLPPDAGAPPAAYFPSPEEMQARFAAWPETLSATQEIAGRCQFELPLGVPHYPSIPLPSGLSAFEHLRQKAEAGVARRYGRITPVLRRRLDYELSVIGERRIETIFLIVEEMVDYARSRGIPISSRGSAASSLVAYGLGITTPDPIQHDLYFERFLNPARQTPPDIDTDLCSRRRDEVIQHVFETYGPERVAMVGTINRFRPRSALGDVAKAHGLSPEEIRRLLRPLPHFYRPNDEGEDEEGPSNESPFAEILAQHAAAPAQNKAGVELMVAEASDLLRLPRHLSVHAGGVVISPIPLLDLVPLQQSTSKNLHLTQFDRKALEKLGLLKLDLLGIRGLTVLGDVAAALYSWQRHDLSTPMQVLEAIPEDDPATAGCVENGRTIGCFQIESPGMRAMLKELRARSVDEIMAALALYRPGPLKGGLKDAFARRHKGEETITHLHPALAPLLQDTYGVIVYQEQVLRIANGLAGLGLAEADLLRRAMSHFDPGKQMQNLRQKFIEGAAQKNGVDAESAGRIWELMAAFAGYGFPKAHAASYALVAWRSAWCKTHYPAEFMAAVLANWGGYYSQRVYLNEAHRLGLCVRTPHVNHSQREFSVAYPQGQAVLYMGLDQVRDLTRSTLERILRRRPFHDLEDFLLKVDPRPLEAANLAKAGALDGFGPIPALLQRIEQGHRRPGQLALFDLLPAGQPDWSPEERLDAQQQILGVSVEAHPLERYAAKIVAARALNTLDALAHAGQRIRVAGIRQTSRRSQTSSGKPMLFLTLEDGEGTLDVIFFPEAYQRARAVLGEHRAFIIEGALELDPANDTAVLHAERAWPLE